MLHRRRRGRLPALALVAAVVVAGFAAVSALVVAAVSGSTGTTGSGASGSLCSVDVGAFGSVSALDADQLDNAGTIIATGTEMDVPDRGLVVALATALQESLLRNLDYGDRDSVGLFQQRPSSGWGSVTELTTPAVAARKFYAALLQVDGWQSMPVTVAAQTVQRSAFPSAYAKWEGLATRLVAAAGADGAISCSAPVSELSATGAVAVMLRSALAQQGDPYVWGATGPDAFDCSGLVVYAWRQAGYALSVRTSEQMYAVSDPVASGEEQPGDLLFSHFGSAGPGHVMIVVEPGLAVEAPSTGDVVKTIEYTVSGDTRIGRLTDAAMVSTS